MTFKGGGGCILIGAVVGLYFGDVSFTIVMSMFLLFGRIWGYVHLQSCHSFVIYINLNYVCGIVQVYLFIGLSFQFFLHIGF
jgi:hypothetical protein